MSGAIEVAEQLVRCLASAVQVAGLYPAGHPNRQDATVEVLVAARRLHMADPDDPPLFVLRRAFYLGPRLLPTASLTYGRLLAACEERGITTMEFRPETAEADVDGLVRMLRGDLPTTAPLPGLWVNRTQPAFDGPSRGDVGQIERGYAFGAELLRQTALRAGDGRPADLETAEAIVAELTAEVLRAPARALLIAAAGAAEADAFRRAVDVAILSIALGNALGFRREDVVALGMGAMLHDVGMLAVPREIVEKQGALTAEERSIVERHVIDGAGLILAADGGLFHPAATIALEHHAGVDGSGYPALGRAPALASRVVAVADAYVAMTSDRPYRRADDRHTALATIAADRRFDADVVRALVTLVGEIPIGTVVVLATGEHATVVRPHDRFADRPVVRIVATGEERDLADWDGFGFVWEPVKRAVSADEGPASAG